MMHSTPYTHAFITITIAAHIPNQTTVTISNSLFLCVVYCPCENHLQGVFLPFWRLSRIYSDRTDPPPHVSQIGRVPPGERCDLSRQILYLVQI